MDGSLKHIPISLEAITEYLGCLLCQSGFNILFFRLKFYSTNNRLIENIYSQFLVLGDGGTASCVGSTLDPIGHEFHRVVTYGRIFIFMLPVYVTSLSS